MSFENEEHGQTSSGGFFSIPVCNNLLEQPFTYQGDNP
jgi:hypothetical protein